MKLLLDTMFDPEIANQLRRRGHDVVAAIDRPHAAKLDDADLFALAQDERRAVVTENVPDFLRVDGLYRALGRAHFGLLLTTHRRYSRSSARTVGQLVLALDTFLQAVDPEPTSLIHWLR